MESSRPGALPVREPRRRFVAPIVFGLIGAVVAVWITVAVATSRDPEETVEAYLSAIAEKDVDGALEFVSDVPYGDTAAFLTPDAISDDWWVVSVTEVGREYSSSARVKAVIAGPGGTAEGEFEVNEYDDEWTLWDPFVTVRFPASPVSYVRVNDKVVPKPADSNGFESYDLFPGIYRFYGSVPGVVDTQRTGAVAAFPSEDPDEILVVPSTLTPAKDTVERLRKAVDERIDECATFTTPAPYGDCPFATDGDIDTPDGKRVSDLHGLTWKVSTYPVVTMTDDRSQEFSPAFALSVTSPGSVALSGSGEDTDGNPTTFTVNCEIDLTGLRATVDARGEVELTPFAGSGDPNLGDFDTCRRDT
ncbi:hypothetical protein [Actinophytocola algeriensis]|uniref:DUF4878 domain-containing protein n=1 Tax=Actinophytocola algeriensis TaxID=1768010 RepID=A0A7W7VI89_9PSEU|nr:hypothetical protein [Actinophytocola algeriensis]MBB4910830.1 hypothetical protein [Actinophytocola algeriensis]MBE1473823.1 hypothetical protein [Actinophytocola algeriensis]